MMGPLHTEMAALTTLGDWLEDSGWCQALVEAVIASPGTAQSFLHASHVSRTRYVHQVSAISFPSTTVLPKNIYFNLGKEKILTDVRS